MRVVRQHFLRHVPGNRHDGLIARLGFGQFGYRVMPQIVETQPGQRIPDFVDVR
jgi:hypothetical protein